MSEEPKVTVTQHDYTLLAVVVLVIFCWGDPDLLDALIHWLMRQ